MGKDSSRPPPASLLELGGTAVIPKPKVDLKDPLWRQLGARPRGNPCRPSAAVTSVKLKDYATSLRAFVENSGTVAQYIIGELLGAEQAPTANPAPEEKKAPSVSDVQEKKAGPDVDEIIKRAKKVREKEESNQQRTKPVRT